MEEKQREFNCVTWGVGVYRPGQEQAKIISDISQSKEFAAQLAALFTREGLEPEHFADAVEDFMACPQRLEEILSKDRQ